MRRQPFTNLKPVELSGLPLESSTEEIVTRLNLLISEYTTTLKALSFKANFDGFIAEDVKIPSTSLLKIQHFLGVKPKWRIILRQVGNGVITDIPSEWNDKVISLYNNGAVEVTLTVFIARE